MTWQDYIDKAFLAGWRVRWCDDVEGFTIISPSRPRHPSMSLGHYRNERDAWRGAANLAHLQHCRDPTPTIVAAFSR
jgi:hypothetical protein